MLSLGVEWSDYICSKLETLRAPPSWPVDHVPKGTDQNGYLLPNWGYPDPVSSSGIFRVRNGVQVTLHKVLDCGTYMNRGKVISECVSFPKKEVEKLPRFRWLLGRSQGVHEIHEIKYRLLFALHNFNLLI